MNDESSRFVSIHRLSNRFEADLLMNALQEEDIPAILRVFEETPYSGLFVTQKGYGLVLVPCESASRALEIVRPLLQTIRKGNQFVDPSELDPLLWERLRQADPEALCNRAFVRREPETGAFVVPFLDSEFVVDPERETIEPLDPAPFHEADFQFCLAMIHYLLEAEELWPSGKWVGAKDIPGGALFFQGVHSFPTPPLLKLFGRRPDAFLAAAEKLGAKRIDSGGLACRFPVYPRIPLLFVLWEGDEEFEANLNILFDEKVLLHLKSLDVIFAMVNVVCRSLRNAGKCIVEGEAP